MATWRNSASAYEQAIYMAFLMTLKIDKLTSVGYSL
jgi:hypothetical protein